MNSGAHTGVSGVILAGGRATRMGGRDKGLVEYRGRRLVEHVIARLALQVDELLVNANRNLEVYGALGYPVIPDTLPGYAGPLAGMLAGLNRATHEYVLCVPCDTPGLPDDLVARLLAGMHESAGRAAYVHDGERAHPLCALLRAELARPLADFLAGGQRKAGDWLLRVDAVAVDFSCCHGAFVNLNAAADLAG